MRRQTDTSCYRRHPALVIETDLTNGILMLSSALPVFLLMPVMAFVCYLAARRISVIEEGTLAHAQTAALDGLRGILASSVFFHHAAIMREFLHTRVWVDSPVTFYSQLGTAPVTMFFFLSGFLFWSKLLSNPVSVSYRALLPNRMRRIAPAYAAAMLGFLLILLTLLAFGKVHDQSPASALSAWAVYGASYGVISFFHFAVNGITGGVFWTLLVEWLFYLVLPLLKPFRAPWRLAALLLPLYGLSTKLFSLHYKETPTGRLAYQAVFFLHALPTAFSVGMLGANLFKNRRFREIAGSQIAGIVAVILAGITVFRVQAGYNLSESLLLAPLFLTVVAGNDFYGLLTMLPARALGQVSYSLYVLHGLVLFLVVTFSNYISPLAQMSRGAYWCVAGAAGIISAIVSSFSYRYIEKPFFRSQRNDARDGRTKRVAEMRGASAGTSQCSRKRDGASLNAAKREPPLNPGN